MSFLRKLDDVSECTAITEYPGNLDVDPTLTGTTPRTQAAKTSRWRISPFWHV